MSTDTDPATVPATDPRTEYPFTDTPQEKPKRIPTDTERLDWLVQSPIWPNELIHRPAMTQEEFRAVIDKAMVDLFVYQPPDTAQPPVPGARVTEVDFLDVPFQDPPFASDPPEAVEDLPLTPVKEDYETADPPEKYDDGNFADPDADP